MRRGSKFAGLSPRSAMPFDDDLLRPWRSWWGISLLSPANGGGPVRAGDRNPFVRSCRFWIPTRRFIFDSPLRGGRRPGFRDARPGRHYLLPRAKAVR